LITIRWILSFREANNNGQREASNGLIGPRIANLGLRGSVGFEPWW
jgi:hypothetical protein